MKLRSSRLLIAPATALALAASSLGVPAASAATVTIEGEQCTITPHQATVDRLNSEYITSDIHPGEALHNAVLTVVPSAASLIDELKRDPSDVGAQEALAAHLIQHGSDEYWAEDNVWGIVSWFNNEEVPGAAIFPGEPTTVSKDDAHGMALEFVGSLAMSGTLELEEITALHDEITTKLRAGDLEGARQIAREALVNDVPAMMEGENETDIKIQQEYFKQLPNSHYDGYLYRVWTFDACVQGTELDKNYYDMEARSPLGSLDPSQLSADGSLKINFDSDALNSGESSNGSDNTDASGSGAGGILGILLGLGAIGALIGGIAFWLQQQGLMR